jgi:Fe-Mn family superoxide dismutase
MFFQHRRQPIGMVLARVFVVADIRNNASQVWSHTFFWNYMKPDGCVPPTGALANAISKKWGSFDALKMAFQTSVLTNFATA